MVYFLLTYLVLIYSFSFIISCLSLKILYIDNIPSNFSKRFILSNTIPLDIYKTFVGDKYTLTKLS